MSKKVLVTGGAGYIGAHTVAELYEAGYDVIIVDDLSRSDTTLLEGLERLSGRKVNFEQGSCCDRLFLKRVFSDYRPIDSVLHFAAYKSVSESVQQPLTYYQNNIDSLLVLLSVMKEFSVKNLIFSSSCTVYGQPDNIPVDEYAPFKRAESPYGATKQICERILEDVYKEGFRVVSLRYFNPIGAHPSGLIGELPIGTPNNLVPYITQTAAGLREKLIIFGNDYNTPDGTCIRDYIHVRDLGVAHVRAMQYVQSREMAMCFDAFNIGTGAGMTVLQMVNAFVSATGVDLPFEFGPRRPGDVEKVYADVRRAQDTLSWQAEISITESLVHAWNWEKKLRGR